MNQSLNLRNLHTIPRTMLDQMDSHRETGLPDRQSLSRTPRTTFRAETSETAPATRALKLDQPTLATQEATAAAPSTTVRAFLLGTRLETKGFEGETAIAVSPLTLRVEGGGAALLFRYGVIVLIGVSPESEILLAELAPRIVEPVQTREVEQVTIRVLPDKEDLVDPSGAIILRELSAERLQVVASALAKSAVRSFNQDRIAAAFDQIEPLADRLRSKGRIGSRPDELLRQIGSVLKIQQLMVGRVEVEEEPEILWIHPEFKRLYARLMEWYQLRERSRAIETKVAPGQRQRRNPVGPSTNPTQRPPGNTSSPPHCRRIY